MNGLRFALVGLLALTPRPLVADDPGPDGAKLERQRRLDFMRAKLGAFELRTGATPRSP